VVFGAYDSYPDRYTKQKTHRSKKISLFLFYVIRGENAWTLTKAAPKNGAFNMVNCD